MAARLNRWISRARGARGRWSLAALLVLSIVLATSWGLTEPLADHGAPSPSASARSPMTPVAAPVVEDKGATVWPEARLDGLGAKRLVLKTLVAAAERLNHVATYTATFRKRERINGALGDEQTLAMKARRQPFAIYFKFLVPRGGAGKEVIYAEGHHDNKLIVHSVGLARFLVPRLAVAPDHPLALADSRHPITEAGLANLTDRLIHYRRMDLDDPEAETVLDRTADAQGRPRLRSVHAHPRPGPDRPFARIEVLYDPETWIPLDIRNYDWPAPGQSGPLLLAEQYRYDDLDLGAALTAEDFDPANPAYAFHRY